MGVFCPGLEIRVARLMTHVCLMCCGSFCDAVPALGLEWQVTCVWLGVLN